MRRWRLTVVLSAISLVLVIGVWLWSRWIWPHAAGVCIGLRKIDDFDFICGVYSPHNKVWYYESVVPPRPWDPFKGACTLQSHQSQSVFNFQYIGYYATRNDWYYGVGMPFWFLAMLFGAIGAVGIRKTRGRAGPGYCGKCGYDLRASIDRCPECGTAIKQPPQHIAAGQSL